MTDDGITRRDFLNGASIAIGASLVTPWAELFAGGFDAGAEYYPPAKTGLRGTHEGAWEVMHARVAGRTWPVGRAEEQYDLVIVGGGISGLASALLYRKERPDARILILDNHDDFGGHAKRNEFSINGTTRIGYGGTESIDTPSSHRLQNRHLSTSASTRPSSTRRSTRHSMQSWGSRSRSSSTRRTSASGSW